MNKPALILFLTGITLFIVSAMSLVASMTEANYYASRMSMMIFLFALAIIATSVHMATPKN